MIFGLFNTLLYAKCFTSSYIDCRQDGSKNKIVCRKLFVLFKKNYLFFFVCRKLPNTKHCSTGVNGLSKSGNFPNMSSLVFYRDNHSINLKEFLRNLQVTKFTKLTTSSSDNQKHKSHFEFRDFFIGNKKVIYYKTNLASISFWQKNIS